MTVPRSYTEKILGVEPRYLIGYWPLAELSGAVALDESVNKYNGAYTGVDLGQPGIGDGRSSALFDGANDYCNIYSASLATAFNGAEGTLLAYVKMANAGVWTDATIRDVGRILVTGATSYLTGGRTATNNQLRFLRVAGGITSQILVSETTTSFFAWLMTWSQANDELRGYINGVQVGTTQTGLGTWAGSLDSANCVIGAANTGPAEAWSGNIAHCALWSTPLTAAQVQYVSEIGHYGSRGLGLDAYEVHKAEYEVKVRSLSEAEERARKNAMAKERELDKSIAEVTAGIDAKRQAASAPRLVKPPETTTRERLDNLEAQLKKIRGR